ncbi:MULTISPECIES: asparagine synthase (glutamine-hydrolyzing) [Streptomyces]|uniref:asparagine synthase (glutamine-hydrolyzing) n=1 Tax=Streptomyces violaceoruber TaxID=1935 RepID=A0A1V0UF49_STRVN|nr:MULTISPECIES: asparagine synthase (glutamine-hydrolyzing) [Streptomyces]ARF63865.1 asparagine synthetase B [Streptomyces violaceoruber]KOG76371.1 asparagine synthase [Streptomyces griseus subsp. rhodochrous]MBD3548131.1 asparagine synthase (glutamine-hydrolyzing) [Streptomyces sp. JV180]MBD3553725.1 asparagine synthase (glutamine-hydrolyzing) [Streptomyces sp. SP18CM02]MDP9951681.1 asparagine synthase (glutamine-hydrolyzing) [Streptomyces sp. DSM 41269]
MCGIAGWLSYRRDLTTRAETVDAMIDTLKRRGPDDSGRWIDRHAALGNRRLSVMDPQGGRQPMTAESDDGTVVLVYTGETYNFRELRGELRSRGHAFRTDGDTEVVLRGYLEWGESVVDRLNGMYAFAVWDGRTEQLHLIRDRLGVKPLFYHPTDDGVLFGSEPKAILANPLAERTVGLTGLRELFSYAKTPGLAFWEGMREVEPGTIVTVGRDGLRTRAYWSLRTLEHTDSPDATVDRVRELLDDISERQLLADVPRCTLLSGGLDSSTLTALAARRLKRDGERVRSFSVDFIGYTANFVSDGIRESPDAPYVRDLVAHCGSDHRDIVLDAKDLADPALRAEVVTAYDFPPCVGDMNASLYLLSKEVRRHSTVALSGECADEVFGGYKWMYDAGAQKADIFPWLVQGAGDETVDPFERAFTPDVEKSLGLAEYARESYRSAVAGIERAPGEDDREFTMRTVSYLHLSRFMQLLLERKDRMSMAAGLEVRVPYCDHRLVEYVYNAPWSMKTADGREKSLLRSAAADILPRSVAERVKSPYPSTQDPLYAAALRDQARDLLASPNHPVFDLVDQGLLAAAVAEKGPATTQGSRSALERALDLAAWFDAYAPTVRPY